MIRVLVFILLLPFRIIFGKFGGGSEIVYIPENHPDMEKAKKEARESLPEFRKLLLSPEPDMGDFAVKVAFPTDGSTEHCWVSELTFDGQYFKGRVSNIPDNVKGLKFGSVVTVKEEMISDWAYSRAGIYKGHFTTRVLLPYMNRKLRKQVLKYYGWKNQ